MSIAVFLVCLICLTCCAVAEQSSATSNSSTTITTPSPTSPVLNDPPQLVRSPDATNTEDAVAVEVAAANKTAADKKRSVLIGDISYSYAATDIGTPHGTHIKTLTVIKNVAIPKHHHGGKSAEAGGDKTGHTDAEWEKNVKNHFNMVVRVPEFPEIPSIHIGSRPASTDRNTKTPVKVEPATPAKATPVVAVAAMGEAVAPAVTPVDTPIATTKCNKNANGDGGEPASEAAAEAALEREIQQSMDHMHRMAHSYNTQRQHQSRYGAAVAAAEPLPVAMSLIHTNHRQQPFNKPSTSRPAQSEANDEDDEDDAAAAGASVAAADHRDDSADLPATQHSPDTDQQPPAATIVRSSFDNIPEDVEFVRLHAEPIASRLSTPSQHNYRQNQQHQLQHHHRQSFVEDFSDYAMHNVQHLADRPERPSPSTLSSSASTGAVAHSHQTQQTADQSRAIQAAATVVTDDANSDNDYTSAYRTINARDEAELNAADAASRQHGHQLPTLPDSTSYAAETVPAGHIQPPDNQLQPASDAAASASPSAAYKINGNRKKVRPYTAPALHKPYRTTSTTTQRVPYQAPIKSQKPAQFYIVHETPTTTQRPYLSPSIYNGYSLDAEQRQRDEQRLVAERDREERQQLELERQQLEQQQRDQLELEQRRRDQREQQQLRDQQHRQRFLHQYDDEIGAQQSRPHADYLQRDSAGWPEVEVLTTTTDANVIVSTASPAPPPSPLPLLSSLFAEDDDVFGGDLHNIIQLPSSSPVVASPASASQFGNDNVEVFAQSIDASAASVSQSQSYRYDKPAGHGRPQPPARKVTRRPTPSSSAAAVHVRTKFPKFAATPTPSPLLPTPAVAAFEAVPLDVSTAPPFQRDHAIGVRHQIPAHLLRHQFVFDSKPPHAFLESPFRPLRKQKSDGGGGTVKSSYAFRR